MLARSLLGIPVRRIITFYANGSSLLQRSEPNYELSSSNVEVVAPGQ
jgi:hypothetical protein